MESTRISEKVLKQLRDAAGAEDPGFLGRFLTVLLRASLTATEELEKGLSSLDLKKIKSSSHALRSNVQMLHLQVLTDLTVAIESEVVAENTEKMKEHIRALLQEFALVKKEIEAILVENKA